MPAHWKPFGSETENMQCGDGTSAAARRVASSYIVCRGKIILNKYISAVSTDSWYYIRISVVAAARHRRRRCRSAIRLRPILQMVKKGAFINVVRRFSMQWIQFSSRFQAFLWHDLPMLPSLNVNVPLYSESKPVSASSIHLTIICHLQPEIGVLKTCWYTNTASNSWKRSLLF